MASTDYLKHFKKVIKKDFLLQQVFNLGEARLKCKHNLEAVMAPYKEAYKDMQKKENQSKIGSFYTVLSLPLCHAVCDLITVIIM